MGQLILLMDAVMPCNMVIRMVVYIIRDGSRVLKKGVHYGTSGHAAHVSASGGKPLRSDTSTCTVLLYM